MKQPPAASGFGFEAFGSQEKAPRSLPPQAYAAPQAMDPPPAYGAHAMYPFYNNDPKWGTDAAFNSNP